MAVAVSGGDRVAGRPGRQLALLVGRPLLGLPPARGGRAARRAAVRPTDRPVVPGARRRSHAGGAGRGGVSDSRRRRVPGAMLGGARRRRTASGDAVVLGAAAVPDRMAGEAMRLDRVAANGDNGSRVVALPGSPETQL